MSLFDLAGDVANLAITITHPSTGALVTVTGGRADYLAGAPVAIDSLQLKWSRPSARDHASPGDLRFSLLTRGRTPSALLAYGALVQVYADIDGAAQLIGRGWVENITRGRVEGLPGWRWDLDVVDAIGRAAGHIVRSEPWPAELSTARYNRLRALGIVGIDVDIANWPVAPRDSDSQSLLSLAQLACTPSDVVGEHPVGLGVAPSVTLTEWTIEPAVSLRIPASHLEDAGVEINRSGSIIQAEVRYPAFNSAEQEWQDATLYRRTDDPRDGSRFSLATDVALGDFAGVRTLVGRWLTDIITATATVRPRLRAGRIRPGPWLSSILPVEARTVAPIVQLTGLPEWQGLDQAHHVTGGVLTLDQGGALTLAIELQPAAWDGWRRAILGDLRPPAGHARPTIGELRAGTSSGRRFTIGDYTVHRRLGTP